jgi:hypothetical protein
MTVYLNILLDAMVSYFNHYLKLDLLLKFFVFLGLNSMSHEGWTGEKSIQHLPNLVLLRAGLL